jgi:hypothetical protein
MDDVTLKIDSGALLEVPIFEKDDCGHNWLAIIEGRDPQAPGGFRRAFCARAGAPFYYLTATLRPGQAIEFGADRVSLKLSRRNRKQPKRAYGVIKDLTTELLTYSPQPNALAALAASKSRLFAEETMTKGIRRFRTEINAL